MDSNATAVTDLEALRHLARMNGVATSFWDWYGHSRDVSADSLLRVLESLGVPVSASCGDEDVRAAITWTEDEPWRRPLPACTVVRAGWEGEVVVHVPHGDWVHVSCLLEDGSSRQLEQLDRWVEPRWVDGDLIGRATFRIPSDLPLGWHRLVSSAEGAVVHSAPLVVVPQRLEPGALADGRRRWGVAAQFYSARSRGSWGIGDAADLADLAAICAGRGADFLLVNPVHATSPVTPLENSPYLPVTRRWVNPLYIRPEAIPEYAHASEGVRARIADLRERARTCAPGAFLDRDTAWAPKLEALELLFAEPRAPHREAAFRAFITEGGTDLADFALWCALTELRDPDVFVRLSGSVGSPLDEMRTQLADRIALWQWCQWVVSEQLAHANRVARDLGMDMGIMADLAVGVHPWGSEPWTEPEVFAQGMEVGAPPDMYAQQGQNWSQPPWSPRALAECGYRPLRDMVRAVLRHAGAVRIDHILGLFRLWWIPVGKGAGEGTYVHYDHEAMLGIVMLEAQRAGAVVIGEDLGTVEPWVRGHLAERGILGTSVLWFEKDREGWPLHARDFRRDVLVTVNTHDLPPTAGYLEGVHTQLRERLGLLVDDPQTVREADALERERTVVRLREYGLVGDLEPSTSEIVEALHRYAVATPSRLLGVSLVDAVGDRRPQNLPGTHLQYPNWCVPLCDGDGAEVLIEDLATRPSLTALFGLVDRTLHGRA